MGLWIQLDLSKEETKHTAHRPCDPQTASRARWKEGCLSARDYRASRNLDGPSVTWSPCSWDKTLSPFPRYWKWAADSDSPRFPCGKLADFIFLFFILSLYMYRHFSRIHVSAQCAYSVSRGLNCLDLVVVSRAEMGSTVGTWGSHSP